MLRCSQLVLDGAGGLLAQVAQSVNLPATLPDSHQTMILACVQSEPVTSPPWLETDQKTTSLFFPSSSLSCLTSDQFGFVIITTDILLCTGDILLETPVK